MADAKDRAGCALAAPAALAAVVLFGALACGAAVTGEAQVGAGASVPGSGVHTLAVVLSAAGADGADIGGTDSLDIGATMSFRALVESLSGGRVAVAVHSAAGGRCGVPVDCLAALRAGAFDIYRATTAEVGRLAPEFHVLDVPYLLETDDVVERVFRGAFFARTRDALLQRTGLRLMALASAGGWRGIATAGRAVQEAADLRGLTLRTADSPVEMAWARALGASPAPLRRSDLPAAVAAGRVDGTTDGVAAVVRAGLAERLQYLTLDRHGYRAAWWLMNEETLQGLPATLRPLVQAGFVELARLSLARARTEEQDAVAAFEAAGGRVHTPSAAQRRSFVMAAGRVSTGYMREHGHEWLVWLEGAIAEAEREIARP